MADYNQLKTAIAEVIRTNGNEEITGEVLQYILLEMVGALGKDYQFAGVGSAVAEIGTPDDNRAWLLKTGHYENYGDTPIDVAENEFAVVLFNGTFAVTKVPVGRLVDDALTENGTNPVEGGAIYQALKDLGDSLKGNLADLSVEADKTVILTDTAIGINVTGCTQVEASALTLKHGSSVIASGDGKTISAIDNVNESASGVITYQLVAVIGGVQRTKEVMVDVVDPVYYGAGEAYTDITTKATARKSAVGSYIIAATAGAKMFILTPAGMTIQGMRMNGIDVPLEASTGILIDGKSYLCYQSSNAYDEGNYTIEVY